MPMGGRYCKYKEGIQQQMCVTVQMVWRVDGLVCGSRHSHTFGKEMLCDGDLVTCSDYIGEKSQCRFTLKIRSLSP